MILPSSNAHQTVFDEEGTAPAMHLSVESADPNRVATWTGAEVPDGARIQQAFAAKPA